MPLEKLSITYLEKQGSTKEKERNNILINKKWLLILEVVRQINNSQYSLHVGRVIFQKICYVLTRSGVETGFVFTKASYGPYSVQVKVCITALYNSNLMIETHVTNNFIFDSTLYSNEELQCLDKTVDLFCRIKNTEQAEIMATVMFSYDILQKQMNHITEEDVFNDVLDWKKHWKNTKEFEVKESIRSLLLLGWIQPEITFSLDEDN